MVGFEGICERERRKPAISSIGFRGGWSATCSGGPLHGYKGCDGVGSIRYLSCCEFLTHSCFIFLPAVLTFYKYVANVRLGARAGSDARI
ncbi:unnamed protein product, partial [Onchocerca ochengi]|uniref:Uncharacterized protein n=1 Tax=Onchocerca ochengi TaxID=42157 RepID=A0A182EVG7_ONCOC